MRVVRKRVRRLSAEEVARLRKRQREAKAKAKARAKVGAAAPAAVPPAVGPAAKKSAAPQGAPRPRAAAPTSVLAATQGPQGAPLAATSELESNAGRPSPVGAQSTPWSVRLEASTDLPLQVGAGVLVETPARIRFRTGFGFLSKAYVDLASNVAQGLSDDFNEQEATLIQDALGRSFLWRNQVGLRPFQHAGLYLHGGYSLGRITGSASRVRGGRRGARF